MEEWGSDSVRREEEETKGKRGIMMGVGRDP
jgi:hypothetical protein